MENGHVSVQRDEAGRCRIVMTYYLPKQHDVLSSYQEETPRHVRIQVTRL